MILNAYDDIHVLINYLLHISIDKFSELSVLYISSHLRYLTKLSFQNVFISRYILDIYFVIHKKNMNKIM